MHSPHTPPQPSSPQSLPAQIGVQACDPRDAPIVASAQPDMKVVIKTTKNPAHSTVPLRTASCGNIPSVPPRFIPGSLLLPSPAFRQPRGIARGRRNACEAQSFHPFSVIVKRCRGMYLQTPLARTAQAALAQEALAIHCQMRSPEMRTLRTYLVVRGRVPGV